MTLLAQHPHKNERVNELVGMRGSDDDEGSITRHFPGRTRVDLAEEELDDDAEDPEEGIIDKVTPSPVRGDMGGGSRSHVRAWPADSDAGAGKKRRVSWDLTRQHQRA